MFQEIINPPVAHGAALFSAVLKQSATDFRVHEVLSIDFSGEGEHLYLQVEKSSMNTDEVVSVLQTLFAVGSADVGLCGLKDRHSVSTQWFSVRTPQLADAFVAQALEYNEAQRAQWGDTDTQLKSMRLIASERHSRKLRRGAHRCNEFAITLRDIQALAIENNVEDAGNDALLVSVEARIDVLRRLGFPAYIGAQRFGEGGRNLQRASQWFASPRKRTSRQQRSLWLSSARSAVFNLVCAARVKEGTWQQPLPGEPLVLDGSKSFFVPDDETDTAQRVDQFDAHPSAPWWGRGRSPAIGDCAEFEKTVLLPLAAFLDGLERGGLDQERRAIRAIASDLRTHWVDDNVLQLTFSLSPGVFATTLIRELATVTEPAR